MSKHESSVPVILHTSQLTSGAGSSEVCHLPIKGLAIVERWLSRHRLRVPKFVTRWKEDLMATEDPSELQVLAEAAYPPDSGLSGRTRSSVYRPCGWLGGLRTWKHHAENPRYVDVSAGAYEGSSGVRTKGITPGKPEKHPKHVIGTLCLCDLLGVQQSFLISFWKLCPLTCSSVTPLYSAVLCHGSPFYPNQPSPAESSSCWGCKQLCDRPRAEEPSDHQFGPNHRSFEAIPPLWSLYTQCVDQAGFELTEIYLPLSPECSLH
ncbi:hypothetical protein STEG23_002151, partial [Scotinomys teguina]